MEEKPNYYAIIPAEVRYDSGLKDKAKLLYAEITALANKTGCCYASNKYFADLYGVSTTTISLLIKNLVESGYIESEIIYKEGTKEILNRYLRILKGGYLRNLKEGYLRKVKDNNTSINNTSKNNIKENIKEKKHKYGEYKNVLLTDKELQLLKSNYDNVDELITYLDEYIEMKGYKAKSHYLCIRKWVTKAVKQNNKKSEIDKWLEETNE